MEARAEARPTVPWYAGRFASWVTSTDHKRIGILYVGTSFLLYVVAVLYSLIKRSQLSVPSDAQVSGGSTSQLFTVHGTTMALFVVVPLLVGLASFLVPLMIGARNVAFPQLHALSYWLYLLGGLTFFLGALAKGGAAKAGIASFQPLADPRTAGHGPDLWLLSLLFVVLSMLLGAASFLVTIQNMRAPGMSWTRMPLFVWSVEAYSLLVAVAMPVIAAGLTMLLLDRRTGTHFFVPGKGGSERLYQDFFWLFGHPEVYVFALPALGVVSEVIASFSGRPLRSYKAAAYSTFALAVVPLVIWAYHAFAIGFSLSLHVYLVIAAAAFAVPVGIILVDWLATIWNAHLALDPPLLFALAFVALLGLAGVSAIVGGASHSDWRIGDAYYVVGHRYFALFDVVFSGATFAIFAGLFYWWPKVFGRMLDRRLGQAQCFLLLAGFLVTFGIEHMLGLFGKREHLYAAAGSPSGWYNVLSTVGTCVTALGFAAFVANVVVTGQRGRRAGNDPWRADTLEWYAASPPPAHNFDSLPEVRSARPVHDLRAKLEGTTASA